VSSTARSGKATLEKKVRQKKAAPLTPSTPSKKNPALLSTSAGSEVMKHLFATALVTLIFEAVIGHIFEFMKIVMQTSPTAMSYGDVLRDITSKKGIGGLWDGFVPWGVVQAVSKGAVFGIAYATAKQVLLPLAEAGKIPYHLAYALAGGIGGGVQGFVLSPLLLLKTRVMTNDVFRENMSIFRTTLLSFKIGFDIIKTEGVGTLMKGSTVFALKRVCDWSSRYFFSDLFEALIKRFKKEGEELTLAEKSYASLLGGVASTCVTLPLDVLVAKTQDAKKAGIKVSPIKLFLEEVDERGWAGQRRAYMQGFEARVLHVCLTTLGKWPYRQYDDDDGDSSSLTTTIYSISVCFRYNCSAVWFQ